MFRMCQILATKLVSHKLCFVITYWQKHQEPDFCKYPLNYNNHKKLATLYHIIEYTVIVTSN